MKFRNGYVSNSSSSSFVIFDNGNLSSSLKENIDRFCVKIEQAEHRKRIFNTLNENRQENISYNIINDYPKQNIEDLENANLPMYLSSFIPHSSDNYDVFYYNDTVFDYHEGGHGVPYNEDWYICLDEDKEVWIEKSINEMIDDIKSRYPTNEEFIRWSELELKTEQKMTYEEYEEWLDLSNKMYYAIYMVNNILKENIDADTLMKDDNFIKFGWTEYGLKFISAMEREIKECIN